MPAQPVSVLIFDDDFESMHELQDCLEQDLGWSVALTADVGVPVRLARERFDLLIIDNMIHPESLDAQGELVTNVHYDGVPWLRTGLAFLERLRAGEYAGEAGRCTPANVPVIVLSAVATSSVGGEVSGPRTHYVEKPFKLEALLQLIRGSLKA